jgi:hypothetical protein
MNRLSLPGTRSLLVWTELALALAFAFALRAEPPSLSDETSNSGLSRIGPLGEVGRSGVYRIEEPGLLRRSVVESFQLQWGKIERLEGHGWQWLRYEATKADHKLFRVWLLVDEYPPRELASAAQHIARYVLQEGEAEPVEYRDRFDGRPVLPVLGAWPFLFPQPVSESSKGGFPTNAVLLGHRYQLQRAESLPSPPNPPPAHVLELVSDALLGVPHNTRQTDDHRRYDGTDYPLVRLTKADLDSMIAAGLNCLNVDSEQLGWIEHQPVFYWGENLADLPYPECLYRSTYLGPTLFLDEPAVGTRDYVIRPLLEKDRRLAHELTPQRVLEAFEEHFKQAKYHGPGTRLMQTLRARPDVESGNMTFLQENLFTWETMISTGVYQLTEGEHSPPSALVFEPPGHLGTWRTLPEIDMVYGCQIPIDDPANLVNLLCGLLRGAARLSGREWGVSIYGAVDPADSPWFLTHAYDLGARLFFFWDTSGLACVPFGECLALSRHLKAHIEQRPQRDLAALTRAAEVLILFPPGYNLGHVHLGKGSLWGLPQLNLERTNRFGVSYRTVMHNVFAEVERCIRLGVAYDLAWDLPNQPTPGYRKVLRIREDGKIEVHESSGTSVRAEPEPMSRPDGLPPILDLEPPRQETARMVVRARVQEGSAPVFYTPRPDDRGVYPNAAVFWELYGPEAENYRVLLGETAPEIKRVPSGYEVTIRFRLPSPGKYRLRAATVDRAGRSAVAWEALQVPR